MKIISAGTNPVQLTRGIEKTITHLVTKLAELSTEVSDSDLINVAAVSAGGNMEVGKLIADAMARVGRQGVVSMEESRTAEDSLYVVEGMQFERGYISPYFVTDPERMVGTPYHPLPPRMHIIPHPQNASDPDMQESDFCPYVSRGL
jgi:chaperonin GroEL